MKGSELIKLIQAEIDAFEQPTNRNYPHLALALR
jgi:hypothetical protein